MRASPCLLLTLMVAACDRPAGSHGPDRSLTGTGVDSGDTGAWQTGHDSDGADTDPSDDTDTDVSGDTDTDAGVDTDRDTDASGDTDTDTDTGGGGGGGNGSTSGGTNGSANGSTNGSTSGGTNGSTNGGANGSTSGGTPSDTGIVLDTGETYAGDTDADTFWPTDSDPVVGLDTGYWLDTDHWSPTAWSCRAGDVRLGWVFPGRLGNDWVVARYFDDTPGTGVSDWTGAVGAAAKTVEGNPGVDVEVPNFRWMDRGFPVLAVADGVVIDVHDGNQDRNVTCTGDWNAITVRHANGYTTTYGHLKRGSLRVRKGDVVRRGQAIATVGSSGCSTHPHVRLELHDCDGDPADPFALGLFDAPPPYDPPLRLMDAHVLDLKIGNAGVLQDPPPDAVDLKGNADLGLGLTMSGGHAGDSFGIDLRRPDGTVQESIRTTLTRDEQRHVWWWNRIAPDFDGTWTVEVVVRDQVVREIPFTIHAQASAFAVEEADLAGVVADHEALGLTPVWLDVYVVAGQRYYNLLSEPTDRPTELWWGLDATTHEDRIDEAASRGLRPIHVDAVDAGDGVKFVGIVAEAPGAWDVATAEAAADYWPHYGDLQTDGLRPVTAVHLDDGLGNVTWTGVWDDADVGQYTTIDDILRSDVYGTQQAQRVLGRNLSYLDARNVGNEAYFVGVWDQRPRGDWSVYTLLELPTLEQKHEEKRALGLRLRGITGFSRYDQHRFAAWWSDR